MSASERRATTLRAGAGQTIAWASSYYLPAIVGQEMARAHGVDPSVVFAWFSAALLASALVGPFAGRNIDRRGGRMVLVTSNALFVLGLLILAGSRTPLTLGIGWLILGVAMGSGLYDAAFATLVRMYGSDARTSMTGVTLMAGFASTVGWPLTAWAQEMWTWRGACLLWAALHVASALALNGQLPKLRPAQAVSEEPQDRSPSAPAPRRTGAFLAFVFAATWFTSTAMAAHFPQLLTVAGASLAAAVAAGALIGPAQVVARVFEFTVLRGRHPLVAARLAALAHPAGALLLLAAGASAGPWFAVLHGFGNGILTIANGALPLALFGAKGYGRRQGWLMLPARVVQAVSPLAFGVGLGWWGRDALWLTVALMLVAAGALLLIRPAAAPDPPGARV